MRKASQKPFGSSPTSPLPSYQPALEPTAAGTAIVSQGRVAQAARAKIVPARLSRSTPKYSQRKRTQYTKRQDRNQQCIAIEAVAR